MKTLLPGIRIAKTAEDRFIIATSGKYFDVSSETATLVALMLNAEHANVEQLAVNLSDRLGYDVSIDDLISAIEQLPRAFFEVEDDRKNFTFAIPLIKGRALTILSSFFSMFFTWTIGLIAISLVFVILLKMDIFGKSESGQSILTLICILLSIIFHEIGHAAACFSVGAKPSMIGFGLKGIFPSFYTDVSDIWMRSRKARMIVDVAGIYFQLIFAAVLTLFSPFFPSLALAVKLIVLLAAFSCLPYFKFDGYWLLGDWIGQTNLNAWIKSSVVILFGKIRSRSLAMEDRRTLVGLIIYFSGFVLIHVWFFIIAINSIRTHGVYVIESFLLVLSGNFNINNLFKWNSYFDFLMSLFFVLLAFPIFILLLKLLILPVERRLSGFIKDVGVIAFTLLCLVLINAFKPILPLFSKNKKYFNEVKRALLAISPPIPNAHNVAIDALVSKYYELIWFWFLSNISVKIGHWVINKTHRVRSKTRFSYINDISGPVVLAAPHFGSFISGALMLLSEIGQSRPIHLFYADPKTDPDNSRYEKFYQKYFPDLSVFFNNKRGVVSVAKALRRGEVVVIMPDVFSGVDLVNIHLMGRIVGVMPGIAYFHRKFGAKVIPILSNIAGFIRVDVHIEKELIFSYPASDKRDDSYRHRFAHISVAHQMK